MAMEITPEEREAMEWASGTIKDMYYNMSDTFKRMYHKEKVPFSSVNISTSLVPFSLNGKIVYYLLKYLGWTVLGKNGSMFSLVTNRKGDRVIWALIEPRIDGVYPELHELSSRLEEPWALEASRLIAENRTKELFHHLRSWIATEEDLCHIDLGIAKVGNIGFFMELKKAYERIDDARKIHQLIPSVEIAFYNIFHRHFLRFYPRIPAFYIMRVMEVIFGLFAPLNRAILGNRTLNHAASGTDEKMQPRSA